MRSGSIDKLPCGFSKTWRQPEHYRCTYGAMRDRRITGGLPPGRSLVTPLPIDTNAGIEPDSQIGRLEWST